ncbi:MAG: peptidylprolyl isomerase [Cyclobacteriaceae bacterium]|nr:peptidylprolyl isomerase [Cyclobacteriaceae bacterium]
MSKVTKGSKVKVHYTGKLTTGEVFDSSEGREPLEFEVGAGMMIAGFDAAVEGMAVGDKKEAHIPAAEAYGEKREELVMEFTRDKLPEDLNPEVGQKLAMHSGEQQVPVTIIAVSETAIQIDANHELAGKDLIFEIEMVEIN